MKNPKYFYRFFPKKEYRTQFIKGRIRFGSLDLYKKIEDARRDTDEGSVKGKYQTNVETITIDPSGNKIIDSQIKFGDMYISGESLNGHYILSLCDDNIDIEKQARKFGQYAVKILDINSLDYRLNKSKKIDSQIGKIKLIKVKYDRDNYLPVTKYQTLPYEYHFSQKSTLFSDEFEWRFVIITEPKSKTEDHIEIMIAPVEDIVMPINITL